MSVRCLVLVVQVLVHHVVVVVRELFVGAFIDLHDCGFIVVCQLGNEVQWNVDLVCDRFVL